MNDSKETVLEKPKRLSTGLFKWGLVFASLSIPVFIPQVHADTIIMRNNALAAKQITGKIVDAKGEPVIGANVVEKGTTNGTITDIDGNFSLDVSDKAVISVSFIGYVSQDMVVGSQATYTIKLVEDAQALDEIVVVSYGTQKKREVTGAITNIKADDLSDIPVGQFAQKLQGQSAGVQINQTTGQPGQGMAFRIRGSASVNGGSEPLFVVDGMPISTGLNNINPDEIESFSVLKDAAATSLYGSRAANGVVLITTKRGKQGKVQVNLNASYGFQSVAGLREPDVMNAHEFTQYEKEYYEDKIKYEGYKGEIPAEYRNPEQYGEGTNWYRELMRTAPIQNYSLSIAGSKDKLNTAVVLGYFKQDGVLHNTNFERYSLRANNDYQINDKIKVGLNIAPSMQISNLQNTDNVWNVISGAFLASPLLSPYDKNGDLVLSLNAPNMFPQPNWLRVLKEKTTQHKVTTVLSNLFAEVDIWNGIKYKFQAGIDIGNHTTHAFTPSTAAGGMFVAPPQKASGEYIGETYYNWTVENMLMYNKRIKEHSIDALLGYSAQKYTYEKSKLTGTDFPNDDIEWIDAAATRNGENNMTQWSLVSLIGRVNYSFKDRYLLQATFRRDGCSRFGPGNKYANFPSVSAGWIASDEAFMEPVTNVMSYLKVRASYGLTGNYNIGDYTYIAGLENTNYVFNGSLYPGNSLKAIGNNDLTWEETKQLDLGVDFGFLNDRIFVQYDFYRKQTNGMLYEIDIPSASGFQNIKSNVGDFKSWGHEITISSKNLVNEFKWTTNFNISFNENEITKLGTNNTAIGGYDEWAGDFNRLQVGQPIGVFVGYVYDGVYMNKHELETQPKEGSSEVGTVRMKDISGPNGVPDGIIDANDRTIIGDPNPLFIFGLNNEFAYKNFDLSILMSGSVGGDIMNGNYEFTENLDGVFNVRPSVANRWRSEENPGDGVTPRTKTGTTGLFRANNSRWVEDGSYLAIKNVTLGYTVPFSNNAYISKVRFYVTGQQLAVFTNYKGMNPEVGIDSKMTWKGLGVDRTTYPVPRSFSIGCNITF